jgi:hypothetical protein
MDSTTVIAVASIATSGIKISFGCMGLALGEGRSVATALTALAQQPDAAANALRRVGNDRVHCHLLLRGLDDSHFCQPVLEPLHRPGGDKVNRC